MSGYGTMPAGPKYRWPTKEPDEDADWTYDATPNLTHPRTGAVDSIVSATLAAQPSGAGELSVSRLSIDDTGHFITVWLSGGVPGREYLVNIEIVTAGGRTYQIPIGIQVDPFFATWPLVPVPNPGYGTELTWSSTDGVLSRAGGYVTLSALGAWPTSSDGLAPGALYAASATAPSFIFAVQGFGYAEGPPLMFGDVTAGALLAAGAVHLPQTDPHMRDQIWVNGEIVCASLG